MTANYVSDDGGVGAGPSAIPIAPVLLDRVLILAASSVIPYARNPRTHPPAQVA